MSTLDNENKNYFDYLSSKKKPNNYLLLDSKFEHFADFLYLIYFDLDCWLGKISNLKVSIFHYFMTFLNQSG